MLAAIFSQKNPFGPAETANNSSKNLLQYIQKHMLAGATLCLVMGRKDGKLDFSAEKGRGRTVKLKVLNYQF